MDGSKRSAHANAYFTGFGAPPRGVPMTPAFGQAPGEGGRGAGARAGALHRHIIQRIVALFCHEPAGLCTAGLAVHAGVVHFTGLGVRPCMGRGQRCAGAAAVPAGGAGVHLLCVAPCSHRCRAKHEFEADAFAAAQTSGQDLSTACSSCTKTTPRPLTPDPVFGSSTTTPRLRSGLAGDECMSSMLKTRTGRSTRAAPSRPPKS